MSNRELMQIEKFLLVGPSKKFLVLNGHTFHVYKAEVITRPDGKTQFIGGKISHHLSWRPDDQIRYEINFVDGVASEPNVQIDRGGVASVLKTIFAPIKGAFKIAGLEIDPKKLADVATEVSKMVEGRDWETQIAAIIAATTMIGNHPPIREWFPPFWSGADAALVHRNGKGYFFRGDRYHRYDFERDFFDKTYAQIDADGWKGVWRTGIDAALVHPKNGKGYFFRGGKYQRFDFDKDRVDKDDADINVDGWKGVWTTGIDAALVHPNNDKAYFFRGDRYQRFDFDKDKVDKEGVIGVNGWRGVWTNGIDAALVHPRNNKAYFFRGDRYQRFNFDSDPEGIDKDNARVGVDGWW